MIDRSIPYIQKSNQELNKNIHNTNFHTKNLDKSEIIVKSNKSENLTSIKKIYDEKVIFSKLPKLEINGIENITASFTNVQREVWALLTTTKRKLPYQIGEGGLCYMRLTAKKISNIIDRSEKAVNKSLLAFEREGLIRREALSLYKRDRALWVAVDTHKIRTIIAKNNVSDMEFDMEKNAPLKEKNSICKYKYPFPKGNVLNIINNKNNFLKLENEFSELRKIISESEKQISILLVVNNDNFKKCSDFRGNQNKLNNQNYGKTLKLQDVKRKTYDENVTKISSKSNQKITKEITVEKKPRPPRDQLPTTIILKHFNEVMNSREVMSISLGNMIGGALKHKFNGSIEKFKKYIDILTKSDWLMSKRFSLKRLISFETIEKVLSGAFYGLKDYVEDFISVTCEKVRAAVEAMKAPIPEEGKEIAEIVGEKWYRAYLSRCKIVDKIIYSNNSYIRDVIDRKLYDLELDKRGYYAIFQEETLNETCGA